MTNRSVTANWLSALRRHVAPREHHHVRTGVHADFARLARIIAGKSVNIVLGGGGALSFSQFGVLRAIQDWKAGMIDPWADGFFGEEGAAPASGRSRRRKAS